MKLSCFILMAATLVCHAPATAQLVQNDIGTHSMVQMGTKTNKVSSSDLNLQGKYLWSKDWHRGTVQMKPGNIIKMRAMKLNFYSNEIQYPEGQDELATPIDNMSKIVVFSNEGDSTAVAATFIVLRDPDTKKDAFFEVLNGGRIQLMKEARISTNKLKVDPIMAQRETIYFYSTYYYFIKIDKKLAPLKSLGKSRVLEAIPDASSAEGWLTSNKNKLKKEEDVVAFLNYLNSLAN